MLEKNIEAHLVREVHKAGGMAYKFTAPGRRSVPDRLRLSEIPEEHRAIVAKYISFIELKAPGKKPTQLQYREHTKLRLLGFKVDVLDSKEAVDEWMGKEVLI